MVHGTRQRRSSTIFRGVDARYSYAEKDVARSAVANKSLIERIIGSIGELFAFFASECISCAARILWARGNVSSRINIRFLSSRYILGFHARLSRARKIRSRMYLEKFLFVSTFSRLTHFIQSGTSRSTHIHILRNIASKFVFANKLIYFKEGVSCKLLKRR